MPRKTLDQLASLKSTAEEFEALSLVRYELAIDAYEYQDDETKAVIDKIVATLRQHANGTVNVQRGGKLIPLKVSDETFAKNLLYTALEVVKSMYFVGLKVANFKWTPTVCIACGAKIEKAKKRGKKQ